MNKQDKKDLVSIYNNINTYLNFRKVSKYKPYERKTQTNIKDLELCEQTLKKVLLNIKGA